MDAGRAEARLIRPVRGHPAIIADADDPYEIIVIFRERMSPGSYLVISHGSDDENPDAAEEASKEWRNTRSSVTLRSPSEIEEFFAGFEMVGPGLVTTTGWGTTALSPTDPGSVLCALGKLI